MKFTTDIRITTEKIIDPNISFPLVPEYSGRWLGAGDINGDGKIELLSARNDNQAVTALSAYSLDGKLIWTWGTKNLGTHKLGYDLPIQLYDITGDGKCEVIFSKQQELLILEGSTGNLVNKFPLPKGLDVADCICFANLSGNARPTDIIIKSRYRQLWAYTSEWKFLWTWKPKWGLKTCHYPTPIDINNDGKDEIFAGHVMLNNKGKPIWRIKSKAILKGGHLDSVRVVHKGTKPEEFFFILSYCGSNYLALINGTGKVLWEHYGYHFESINVGYFNDLFPGPQFYVDIDHTAIGESEGHLFDYLGNHFGTFKLDYGRHHKAVDWTGDGNDDIVIVSALKLCSGDGDVIGTFRYNYFLDEKKEINNEQSETETLYGMLLDISGMGNGDLIIHSANAVNIYMNPVLESEIRRKPQNFDLKNATFY